MPLLIPAYKGWIATHSRLLEASICSPPIFFVTGLNVKMCTSMGIVQLITWACTTRHLSRFYISRKCLPLWLYIFFGFHSNKFFAPKESSFTLFVVVLIFC